MTDAHADSEARVSGSRKLLLVVLLVGLVAVLFFYDQGAAEHYVGKAYSKVGTASQKVVRWTSRVFDSSAPNCPAEPATASDASTAAANQSTARSTPGAVDVPAKAAQPATEVAAVDANSGTAPAPTGESAANPSAGTYPPGSWSSIPEHGSAPRIVAAMPPSGLSAPPPSVPKPEAVIESSTGPVAPPPAPAPLSSVAPAEAPPVASAPRPPIPAGSYPVRPSGSAPLLEIPSPSRPTTSGAHGSLPEGGLAPARTAAAEKRVDDAIREYRKHLAANPNDTNAFGELGNVYLSAGRGAEAAQNYYEAATRMIDAGRIDAVAPLMPIIRRHEPMLYALLERKAARAVQGDGTRPRR